MTTIAHQPELIETMCADAQGGIALLERHLQRLERSAQRLGYQWPGRTTLLEALDTSLSDPAHVSTTPRRVRLWLTPAGALHIETAPLAALSPRPRVGLATLTLRSDEPWLQHKTTHRPWYQPATSWLTRHPDYFDLIFLNERDELCEGSRSNLYIKKGPVWVTPPLSCGLLAGVVRQRLLESGEAVEGILTRAEFEHPEAQLRLSNGLRDWFDVQATTSLLPGSDFP